MTDVVISPNMSLPVPIVGTETGPQWATDINACMSGIDSHDHSAGRGVLITPTGLTINTDLPMNGNDLTSTGAIVFDSLVAALSILQAMYVVGVDLYYTDGNGNQIRITQGGSVSGSAGTITGLPSGTAGASFSAGTFTFQSATNTPATMAVGPLVIGAASAGAKTVTFAPSGSQPANYNLTLPLALPASTSILNVDTSGNMGAVTITGSGSVVCRDTPTIETPTITSPALSGGTIDNTTITNSGINGTPIGSSVPATGKFTSLQISTSTTPFKMQQFSGTLTANTSLTVLAAAGYTTLFSLTGLTSYGATSTNLAPMASDAVDDRCNVLANTTGVIVANNDLSRSHLYNITIYYI